MGKLMNYNEVDIRELDKWLRDEDWELQQKVDGIRARLIVNSDDGEVKVIGAYGQELASSTAAPVTAKLIALGEQLLCRRFEIELELEGEIVGDKIYIFDMPKNDYPFNDSLFTVVDHDTCWFERRRALDFVLDRKEMFFGEGLDWLAKVITFTDYEDKRSAWDWIVKTGCEGAVLKHRDGTINDDDRVSHVLKAKITSTADCFVLERGPGNGVNGSGNSMRLGIYRKDGSSYEVGKCSFIGKPYASEGDVVEVKYLYASGYGRLVQPTMLRVRHDKTPQDCTTDQLRFVSKKVIEGVKQGA